MSIITFFFFSFTQSPKRTEDKSSVLISNRRKKKMIFYFHKQNKRELIASNSSSSCYTKRVKWSEFYFFNFGAELLHFSLREKFLLAKKKKETFSYSHYYLANFNRQFSKIQFNRVWVHFKTKLATERSVFSFADLLWRFLFGIFAVMPFC